MERVMKVPDNIAEKISNSKIQLFFCGGHGGLVKYDGKGGSMTKEGGPIDRVFVLRNDEYLAGDTGLDIEYGHIEFNSGPLAKDVQTITDEHGDSNVIFEFAGNSEQNAVEIKGGIHILGIPIETTLVRANVQPSKMIWVVGDKTGHQPMLPYTAIHTDLYLHPTLAKWAQLETPSSELTGSTAWCKISPPTMNFKSKTNKGQSFVSQQHLGYLRIFV